MNKSLKMLIAVAVLAFVAAGTYYAVVAPAKSNAPNTASKTPSSGAARTDSARVTVGGAKVGGELPGSMPANATPSPIVSEPAPAPATASQAPAGQATVPGFTPTSEPMQPLPSSLQGFTPTQTTAAPAVTPTTPPQNAAPAASAPSQVAPRSVPPLPPAPGAPAVAPATRTVAAPAAAPVTPAAPTKPARAETYTVKEGDSLASIWRGLTGSERGWEKLQAANPGLDPSRLKIGQVLKVPDWSSTATPAKPATAAPVAAAGTHTVASGDTLSSIAQKVYGESRLWKRIYDANKDVIGSDPANLKVGQVLRIPPKTGEVASPAAPAPKPAPAAPAAPVAPPTTPPGTIGAPTATPAPAPTPKPQSP